MQGGLANPNAFLFFAVFFQEETTSSYWSVAKEVHWWVSYFILTALENALPVFSEVCTGAIGWRETDSFCSSDDRSNYNTSNFRAVFNWVSIIYDFFFLLYCTLWLVAKFRANFSTNEKQNKTNLASLARFIPALGAGLYSSNSDWSIVLFTFFVIGRRNYFAFGFTTQLKIALLGCSLYKT